MRDLAARLFTPREVAVVGAGDYALGLICQLEAVGDLSTSIVVDRSIEKAREALIKAGVPDDRIVVAENAREIADALNERRRVVTEDITLVPDSPVHVVVDCTGAVDAGARLAYQSIMNEKHVVEVNVEMDCVVGPILGHLADKLDVVYTAADGDQPSLVAGLVAWVRSIGLEPVAAGKGTSVLSEEQIATRLLRGQLSWSDAAHIDGTKSQIEMASVCNMTGLKIDKAGFHKPRVTLEEAVEVFAPVSEGGILETLGVVDYINCLGADGTTQIEPRVAHGVFAVVTAANPHALRLMHRKGVLMSKDGRRALLYRPHHLCGVETITSIRSASIHGRATGAPSGPPVADVVAVAKTDLAEGTLLDGIGGSTVRGLACRAEEAVAQDLLPIGLADRVRLRRATPKGTLIRRSMVETTDIGFAWTLRSLQDQVFFDRSVEKSGEAQVPTSGI